MRIMNRALVAWLGPDLDSVFGIWKRDTTFDYKTPRKHVYGYFLIRNFFSLPRRRS